MFSILLSQDPLYLRRESMHKVRGFELYLGSKLLKKKTKLSHPVQRCDLLVVVDFFGKQNPSMGRSFGVKWLR